MLPFGNITKLFGVEDGFSFVVILMIFLLFCVGFASGKVVAPGNISLFIIICLSIVNIFGAFWYDFSLGHSIQQVLKLCLLFAVCVFLDKNDKGADKILFGYHKYLLSSFLIGLFCWFFYPAPEFVFYDGSEWRFAGLHFELFNFCFSLVVGLMGWQYGQKPFWVGWILFFVFGFLSKSNFFFVFALIVLAPGRLVRCLSNRLVASAFVLGVCASPMLIGLFLNKLEVLMSFGLREQTSFDHNGSSIYTRLYPFHLATSHISELGWSALFPKGLGYFEALTFDRGFVLAYGGTGSPKAAIDLGLGLFSVLVLYLGAGLKNVVQSEKLTSYPLAKTYISALFFISFGAGFFNFFAWILILLTLRRSRGYGASILYR